MHFHFHSKFAFVGLIIPTTLESSAQPLLIACFSALLSSQLAHTLLHFQVRLRFGRFIPRDWNLFVLSLLSCKSNNQVRQMRFVLTPILFNDLIVKQTLGVSCSRAGKGSAFPFSFVSNKYSELQYFSVMCNTIHIPGSTLGLYNKAWMLQPYSVTCLDKAFSLPNSFPLIFHLFFCHCLVVD